MATPTKKQPRKTRPYWERGYFSHSYWRRGGKLGTVKLGPKGEWNGVYRWEAGNLAGEATTLGAAKRAVEHAVDFGASQLGLFDGQAANSQD